MNKQELSFSDVEQLLSELAQHDLLSAAQDEAQTELMREAARGEIRRVFFHRRCWRVAGSSAMLVALGGAATLFLPEHGVGSAPAQTLATSLSRKSKAVLLPQAEEEAAPAPFADKPAISYSATLGGQDTACEVVIYSVPL